MDVVGLLREKQTELGIELDGDFAKLLGISHPYLSLLYSGKRGPGAKLVLHMVQLWPDIFSGNGDKERAELVLGGPGEGGDGERH